MKAHKNEKPKKLHAASKMVNENKLYSIEDAIEAVKQTSYAKFDATVEAHFNVAIDTKSGDQNVRAVAPLPHGTGKQIRIAVFAESKAKNADLNLGEEDITKIEGGKIKPKVDFDIIVSEPSFLPKLAKVAKILGPAGVMPNPKTGTISTNPEKTVEELKKGRVELKNEATSPIVHTKIGKISFATQALKENFLEVYKALKAAKPQKVGANWIKSCYLSATMGPSVKVDLSNL